MLFDHAADYTTAVVESLNKKTKNNNKQGILNNFPTEKKH